MGYRHVQTLLLHTIIKYTYIYIIAPLQKLIWSSQSQLQPANLFFSHFLTVFGATEGGPLGGLVRNLDHLIHIVVRNRGQRLRSCRAVMSGAGEVDYYPWDLLKDAIEKYQKDNGLIRVTSKKKNSGRSILKPSMPGVHLTTLLGAPLRDAIKHLLGQTPSCLKILADEDFKFNFNSGKSRDWTMQVSAKLFPLDAIKNDDKTTKYRPVLPAPEPPSPPEEPEVRPLKALDRSTIRKFYYEDLAVDVQTLAGKVDARVQKCAIDVNLEETKILIYEHITMRLSKEMKLSSEEEEVCGPLASAKKALVKIGALNVGTISSEVTIVKNSIILGAVYGCKTKRQALNLCKVMGINRRYSFLRKLLNHLFPSDELEPEEKADEEDMEEHIEEDEFILSLLNPERELRKDSLEAKGVKDIVDDFCHDDDVMPFANNSHRAIVWKRNNSGISVPHPPRIRPSVEDSFALFERYPRWVEFKRAYDNIHTKPLQIRLTKFREFLCKCGDLATFHSCVSEVLTTMANLLEVFHRYLRKLDCRCQICVDNHAERVRWFQDFEQFCAAFLCPKQDVPGMIVDDSGRKSSSTTISENKAILDTTWEQEQKKRKISFSLSSRMTVKDEYPQAPQSMPHGVYGQYRSHSHLCCRSMCLNCGVNRKLEAIELCHQYTDNVTQLTVLEFGNDEFGKKQLIPKRYSPSGLLSRIVSYSKTFFKCGIFGRGIGTRLRSRGCETRCTLTMEMLRRIMVHISP